MEPTRTLRRAVCIAAVALVMIAGGGCRAGQVADDAARVADDAVEMADDAARAAKNRGKTSKYIKNGAEVGFKVQDAYDGSEDELSK
jgi:hypothetical protein